MVGDVARRIAVDELDPVGDTEFFSPAFRLLGEQLAQVDARADDAVIACPGAQHLARTATEVEHPGPRFQTQRRAERGELFGCERVVDAVSAFGDVEYSRMSTVDSLLGVMVHWAALRVALQNVPHSFLIPRFSGGRMG